MRHVRHEIDSCILRASAVRQCAKRCSWFAVGHFVSNNLSGFGGGCQECQETAVSWLIIEADHQMLVHSAKITCITVPFICPHHIGLHLAAAYKLSAHFIDAHNARPIDYRQLPNLMRGSPLSFAPSARTQPLCS